MGEESDTNRLSDLTARYWHFQCAEFPLSAILAGESVPDAVLFREAPADYDRRHAETCQMLEDLADIPVGDLPERERATYRLLRHELEDARDQHDVLAHHRPPLLPVGPEFAAVQFANTAAITNVESAERYVERLASLPAFIRDVGANLKAGHADGIRYPQIVLEGAVSTVRGSIAGTVEGLPWNGPFKRSPAAGNEAVRRLKEQALGLIGDQFLPALRAHADLLAGPLSEGARSSIACTDGPLGREYYLAQVRHYTTTDLTAEEIHELGQIEVARLDGEIEAVVAQAGHPGDVAAFRRFMATDPQFIAPSKEALREQAESLAKRIDKRIPAFFGRIPRITYGVESMTEQQSEHMPPAYAQINPADRSAPGIYWLTGLPAKCPSHMLVPMALHEGWPGHLMHLALIQEMEDLPAFRRFGATKYSACLEGWALYCEGLGVEMGLYQTPHQQYGRLEMELWRALRMVVDTGIHWLGWNRAQAVDVMAQRLSLPREAIEAEVNRYIALPGQALAYQIGNLKIRALRQRAERRLGDRFDLRAFHDKLMATGPVTLPLLEDLIEHWLASST